MKRILKKHRRIIRFTLRVLFGGGLTALVVLFLLAQRKPAWYAPVQVTSDDLPGLRREVTRQLDDISRKMVQKRPFTVTWTQEQLTQRLATFPDLWPDSKHDWPPELSAPVINIEDGSIRIGAFFQRSGWRAIVGLRFAIDVVPNSATSAGANPSHLRLTLIEATAGSLSAPRWLLRRWFSTQLASLDSSALNPDRNSDDPQSYGAPNRGTAGITIDQLFQGVQIENNFTWPNGKRPFKITRIIATPVGLTLHIQPT